MAETMLLIPVRTSKQGTALNAGKLKEAYQQETSTARFAPEDLERLGLATGDKIRLRSSVGEVEVTCQPIKGKDMTPGLIFIAYGPTSSQLMEEDTAGSGMPLSKHIEVEIEGPVPSTEESPS